MKASKRLGIMGGTFDPVHNGHLVCAEEARVQFNLDEVLFIPAGIPWQKADVSSAEDRYMMTMLGTSANQYFSVSRLEIDRGGPTYTLDTLTELKAFYPEGTELFFITGADAVIEILSWKDPASVLNEATFIAATRPTYDLARLADPGFGGRIQVMQIPALEISSTDIRQRVCSGMPIRYLVPREVGAYIESRALYLETSTVSG